MIIFKDIISGDEMFSDSYKLKVVDDFFYEVEGKLISEKLGVDDALLGANKSADGGDDEGAEDGSRSGVDIVLANRLNEIRMDKKAYTGYIKDYMKAVKQKLEKTNADRVSTFMSKAQEQVKKVLSNFDNYQLFLGESMNYEGMVALLNFREDGVTPYMLFFKDGLDEEKC